MNEYNFYFGLYDWWLFCSSFIICFLFRNIHLAPGAHACPSFRPVAQTDNLKIGYLNNKRKWSFFFYELFILQFTKLFAGIKKIINMLRSVEGWTRYAANEAHASIATYLYIELDVAMRQILRMRRTVGFSRIFRWGNPFTHAQSPFGWQVINRVERNLLHSFLVLLCYVSISMFWCFATLWSFR